MRVRPIQNIIFYNTADYNAYNNRFFHSINLVDYMSIKNGSYSKLMKAYCKHLKEVDKDDNTNKIEKPAINLKKQELLDIMEYNNKLEEASNKLLQKGKDSLFKSEYTEKDKEVLYSEVLNFIKSYNTLLEKGNNSSIGVISRISRRLRDTANDNKKPFEAVGISIDATGKLDINKDTFMKADMKEVKNLFSTENTFNYFINQRLRILNSALNNEIGRYNIYTKQGTYNVSSVGTLYSEKV